MGEDMSRISVNNDLILQVPNATNDVDKIYPLVNNSRGTLAKWLPWALTETREIQQKFFEQNLIDFKKHKSVCFGILYQNHYAGLIGFNTIDYNLQQSEIGYWLADEFVGHGIMHDALLALVNYGFNEYQLKKIILKIAVDNKRSNQVAINAGFKLNRVIKNGLKLNDGFHDENEWILLNL